MGRTSGYLVIYSQNHKPTASIYDAYLNYLNEADPESDNIKELMMQADSESDIQDVMWSEVLGELTPEERAQARAYKLRI